MSSITFVHSTDWHLRSNNPPSRLGNYLHDIIAKIHKLGDIGREYNADFHTCGGDVFEVKEPKGTPHSLMYPLVGAIRSFGKPCYGIPGNHDLRFDRDDTLPEQPLGILFRSGVMVRQVENVVTKDGISVCLHGFPFAERPDMASTMLTSEKEALAQYHVLSLHVYASPGGGTLHGKTYVHNYAELAQLGYDVVLLGHYHADQGVRVVPGPRGPCTIVNIGSLSRGDYGDENLERIPKCCVVTIGADGVRTEEVPVGARPAREVFDLQKKKELKDKEEQAEAYACELAKVAASASEKIETEGQDDVEAHIVAASESLEEEVVLRVKGFIRLAEESLSGNL